MQHYNKMKCTITQNFNPQIYQINQNYYNKSKTQQNKSKLKSYLKASLINLINPQQIIVKNLIEQESMSDSGQNDPSKNLNEFNKFLTNNIQFLTEKYQQHYKNAFPISQLQTKSKIQISIKFIYDVFSFQKYQKDQKMNATLRKSLRQNVLSFLKTQNHQNKGQNKGQNKSSISFTSELAIKLLKYCIENNQMFAVHYDKKDKPKLQYQPSKKQVQIQIQQPCQRKSQLNQIIQDQNSPYTTQQIASTNAHIIKVKSEKSIYKEQKMLQKQNNEVLNSTKIQAQTQNLQILRKEAKVIFQFYCKQQLNAGGPNATFDKISHQANSMTLGKFMAFANTTGILYVTRVKAVKPIDKQVLDKKTIIQAFRKISKGQKQIHFQKFFEIIQALNQIDGTVYTKLNMGKNETSNKILRKLKYLNIPFNMKGHFSKDGEFNVDEKMFVPITTGHSGKFTTSITQDMQQRKQKLRCLPLHPYRNPNQIKFTQSQMNQLSMVESHIRPNGRVLQSQIYESKIRQNQFLKGVGDPQKKSKTTLKQNNKIRLQNSRISINGGNLFEDLGILKDMIYDDDTNEDQFLKQYKIPKLGSNIGLRKKDITHLTKTQNLPNKTQRKINRYESKTYKLQQKNNSTQKKSDPFDLFKNRRNIVGNLKERVKQIQKSEKNHQSSVDAKRLISNPKTSRY